MRRIAGITRNDVPSTSLRQLWVATRWLSEAETTELRLYGLLSMYPLAFDSAQAAFDYHNMFE